MDDATCVRLTLAGNSDAYAHLVRSWARRITALCHARVGRADVADDLAQETFLRAFRALSTLSHPDKFGAWLCGIAHRACLDWRKAKERSQVSFSTLSPYQHPDDFLPTEAPAGEPDLDRLDERRRVLAEVEALPEVYRQVVFLHYYEERTYRDLAQLLGVSSATVNVRLARARAMLRERLSDCRR